MRVLSLAAVLGASIFLGGSGGAAVGQAADADRPRVDFCGDPLPEHALARLGTERLSPSDETWAIALSPDGKTVASGVIPGATRGDRRRRLAGIRFRVQGFGDRHSGN